MDNTIACPICGDTHARSQRFSDFGGYEYYCNICGLFHLGNYVLGTLENGDDLSSGAHYNPAKLRSAMFYYLKVIRKNPEQMVHFYAQNNNEGISLNTIYSLYPETFSQKLDMIMELLHTEIKDIGDESTCLDWHPNHTPFSVAQRFALLADDSNQLLVKHTFEFLEKNGFIEGSYPKTTFTLKGWEKVESLQRSKKSQTAFIAMSFHTDNPLVMAAENSIKEALIEAKYSPVITKDIEYNQSIPEQIEYEIKHSQFIVAELLEQNNGAYYEAGLAKGLGKDVIFTCHQEDFTKIHFDTKHMNIIVWDDADKLKTQLYKRIKYTIGEYTSLDL